MISLCTIELVTSYFMRKKRKKKILSGNSQFLFVSTMGIEGLMGIEGADPYHTKST